MSKEDKQELRALQKDLARYNIAEDVILMVGTLIGFGDQMIQEVKLDHIITQEAARAQNAEIFVALAKQKTPSKRLGLSMRPVMSPKVVRW